MQQIKYFYQILSEISCAISCCLPTSQLATVTHAKFESKYFISLKLGNYQLPCMSSKFGGMCRSRELYSQDDKLWNFCQNLSLGKFFQQDYLFFFKQTKKTDSQVDGVTFHILDWISLRHFVHSTKR